MTQRDRETREASKRPQWKPASLLPVPDPQAGYNFRYVRVGQNGSADLANFSKRKREGWEPVKLADHPELEVMTDVGSRFKDGVEIGGLLLCKNSSENVAARREHYADIANQQMNSVDETYLRQNDPRMPLYKPERRSRTSFRSEG